MADLRVLVAGAGGRMGVANICAVTATPGLVLHAAIDRLGSAAIGRDAGLVAGIEALDVAISDDMNAGLEGADIIVDFTAPASSVALAQEAARRGLVHIIGTTGCSEADDAAIAQAASEGARIVKSGNFSMGMVVLAFCNSVIAFLLHLFLGLPFPALMGVLAFLITLIPLIGSVLYWITATTLALFTGWVPALIFAIIYLVYMQLEAYVLTPRVMNRAISVPGALVVIGAMVGGTLLGLLGALVAIPVTASILLIIKQVFIPRQDAKL